MRYLCLLFYCISIKSFAGTSNPSLYNNLKEYLLKNLDTCEIYQLTSEGMLPHAGNSTFFYHAHWSIHFIKNRLINDLMTSRRIGQRHTIALQLAHVSSVQSAESLRVVIDFMKQENLSILERRMILEAAEKAYFRSLQDNNRAGCLLFKWGNRKSDVFSWPIENKSFDLISKIFEFNQRRVLARDERDKAQKLGLSLAEYRELAFLSMSSVIYQKQFEFLAQTRGSWRGNLVSDPFVCTDEAFTHYHFISWLEEKGFLSLFRLKDGLFSHRGGLPLSDHFAIILLNKRSEVAYVYDSWHRDGGRPPVLSRLEWWSQSREKENEIFSPNWILFQLQAHFANHLIDLPVIKDDWNREHLRAP